MKICTICKIEKPFTEFTPRKKGLAPLHAWCRICLHARKREYATLHGRKSRAKIGPPKPPKPKAPRKPLTEEQKISQAAKAKAHREQNKEDYAARKARYRAANRGKLNQAQKLYYEANRESYSASSLERKKRRYREDPLFALEGLCRRRILIAMQKGGYKKSTKTETILGCSYEDLIKHLESKFLPGMTWANRGKEGWHLDHKTPLASASTAEELEALCHFSNLQPLWALDNYSKGAKMPHELTG